MAKTNTTAEEQKLFFSDGSIREKKIIKNGKLEGEYTSYYKNGQILGQLY